ncbi:serpin family protein [Balneolales bacterium ANBcel1]|nr:serpin family protein [Balneolales bacterium ANBcel1]
MTEPHTDYHTGHPRFRTLTLAAAAVSLIFIAGCDISGTSSDPEPPGQLRELSAQEQVLVEGSNDFTFRLLEAIAEGTPEESFFASPLSISMAFGMALNGTDGDTYTQMRDFFGHDGLSNEEINRAFRDLIGILTDLDPQVRMEIANSIWYRKGFEVLQEFLNTNAEYFNAEIADLDFGDPAAPDIINGWIEEATEGLIEEMIEAIGPDVVMYLINAIYFKADWTVQFDPDDTRDRPFTTGSGDLVEVPMMRVKDEFRFYQNDHWQVVDLGYGAGGSFSFIAMLPRDEDDPGSFSGSLTLQQFESLTSRLQNDTVEVHMPRFEIDFDYEDIMFDLYDMGLTIPFHPGQADFSRINPMESLFISNVMHLAVIKVDEEGSEAAAVTVIEIVRTSAGGPSHKIIRLDRPFLFFIRENSSNTILFMGKYAGPDA